MDYSVLEKSTLFSGVPTKELRDDLEAVPHHIQCYDKDETVFHLMEDANRIGVILEGRAQAQKPFPNGSQVNVSVRNPGYDVSQGRYPFTPAEGFTYHEKLYGRARYRNLHATATIGAALL